LLKEDKKRIGKKIERGREGEREREIFPFFLLSCMPIKTSMCGHASFS
jgi:hypothetical protein